MSDWEHRLKPWPVVWSERLFILHIFAGFVITTLGVIEMFSDPSVTMIEGLNFAATNYIATAGKALFWFLLFRNRISPLRWVFLIFVIIVSARQILYFNEYFLVAKAMASLITISALLLFNSKSIDWFHMKKSDIGDVFK